MNKTLAQSTDRGFFKLLPNVDSLCSTVIQGGCVIPSGEKMVAVTNGYLPLNTETFNDDALIMENHQLSSVTLCDAAKKPYLTVSFDSPLVGLWSPPHKNAPFVCIEPWYGRADKIGYDGTFEDKDWMNILTPGKTFKAKYQITIE